MTATIRLTISSQEKGAGMDTAAIMMALEDERDRLDRAIAAQRGKQRGPGRSATGRKRTLSASAHKRISDAQKKRWAARKKAV
jgi:hypothetical protein